MFASRLLAGGIVGALVSPFIHRIARDVMPNINDAVDEQTRGNSVYQKGDITIYSVNDKGNARANDLNDKSRMLFEKPIRTALLGSTAIAVGMGAVLTARSIAHYNRECKVLEELYASRLKKAEGTDYVPTPPTKDDLNALHKWRSHARAGKNRGDMEDAATLGATIGSLYL